MDPIFNFVLLGMIGSSQLAMLLFIPVLLAIIPLIFYLLTLQNTFKAISDENRKMQPGEVWLSLIPIFGYIWQFFIVTKMADSLSAELKTKGIEHSEERPAYNIGLIYCILMVAASPLAIIIGFLGSILSIAGVVFWILYWVKIEEYRKKLLA